MKVPSSPDKRYLSGADWCLAAMNWGTAETTGRRCVFHVAVFLEGAPDAEQLDIRFKAYCARFPVLWGAPARCWCLAPYWKYPERPDPKRPTPVGRVDLPEGTTRDGIVRHIEMLTQSRASRDGWSVALDILLVGEAACVLAFSFDHCLFDAVGAETFVNLFFRHLNGEAAEADYPAARQTAPAQLDAWKEKFKSGQIINRMMRRLAEGTTSWLPLPSDADRRPFRFRVLSFSAEESKRLQERAFQVAGYLMFTPYVLATAAAVFRPVFSKRDRGHTNFVVSVSTDKPKASVRTPHFFFNDLSFLYYQFPIAAAADRDALAVTVREQLVGQVKDGIPAAIENANLLMRILSPGAYWRFLMRFYRNRLASFGFTCLGVSAVRTPAVTGCRVRDLIHFPVIPAPPGIGLILNTYGGATHAVLSYLEGILSEEEADRLMGDLRGRLLDEHSGRR